MSSEQTKQLHPFGHGGDLRTAARLAGVPSHELLDFSASINPLGPPSGLFTFLSSHMSDVVDYPDPACGVLCERIRDRYGISTEIVPGNGAGELIYLVMRAIPSGPVLIPAPTFSLYEKAAKAAGREVSHHILQQCDNYTLNVASFCADITRVQPALAVLCNPNNPTGTVLDRNQVRQIADTCARTGTYLMLDEAFLEFCQDWDSRTMLGREQENIMVLYSMTKMYAIPGLRLGFLTATPKMAAAIQRLRDPWSVSTLAQLAGEYVLQDTDFVRCTVNEIQALSCEMREDIENIGGFRLWPPLVNYLFLESLHMSSHTLQYKLLQDGILIRDCGNFRGLGSTFVRIAVRTREENKRLMAVLNKILNNGGNQ
jgi:threonine-phosphate decarboxylase